MDEATKKDYCRHRLERYLREVGALEE